MSRDVPQRGDILDLSLDPTHGREIRGARPVLVLSADALNKASGLLLVAPITQGGAASRETGFSVPLMGTGTRTPGSFPAIRPVQSTHEHGRSGA